MRKTAWSNLRRFIPRLFCLLAFFLSLASLHGQEPAAPAATMPTDPDALMLLAAKTNTLTAGDVRPWHLKATCQFFDQQGNVTGQGTYEEFWASSTKDKRSFTSKDFSETEYVTDKGAFRSGTREEPPTMLLEASREFTGPLPSPQVMSKILEHESFTLKQINAGGAKLSCLPFTGAPSPGLTYCFGTEEPVLRISAYGAPPLQIIHNRILKYDGHFVPGDLQFMQSSKIVFAAHLESIEPLDPANDSDFTPSSDAVLIPHRINISAGIAVGMLIKKVQPEYPPYARAAFISGTVVLQARIGVDGHITDLHVVSGPIELQQAALDAVKQWVYRPYLLNGDPIVVQTTINVVFSLTH